jgi:acetyl-CoA carboxylase carboxyl transferase subunit alpha
VDEIVPEPAGGAHADAGAAAQALGEAVSRAFDDLCARPPADLVAARYAKFRAMGWFETAG